MKRKVKVLLKPVGKPTEILYIEGESSDDFWREIKNLVGCDCLELVQLKRNYGELCFYVDEEGMYNSSLNIENVDLGLVIHGNIVMARGKVEHGEITYEDITDDDINVARKIVKEK